MIASPVLCVIVYLLARKRGKLTHGLGAEALRRRRQVLTLVAGAAVIGVP